MNVIMILYQITMILLKKTQRCHHHIPFQNTDTSDDNAKGLSDDEDSTGVSAALPELHTTAYE